jgi:dienelactone hydrolase
MHYDADAGGSAVGIGTAEHTAAGLAAMLLGQGFARYEIWDGIRAVDYLLTRKEVDPKRIAVAGNSGGGTQAAYLAVFEPRLAAVISSCYMTRWRELWHGPGPQDAEQVWPGFISAGLDFDDFALAFAPRPYLMTTAIRDYFPIDGARATYRRITDLFERLGASQNAGYFEYDDSHGWSRPRREAAYRWLDKHFAGRETDGAEPAIQVEPESRLLASVDERGQAVNADGSLHGILLEQWRALEPKRRGAALNGEALRALIRERLGVGAARELTATGAQETEKEGLRIRAFTLERGGGARAIPARLLTPVSGAGSPVITIAMGAEAEALAKAGHAALALEPAGFGDQAPADGRGYSPLYQLAAKAWLLGRNLPGMAVEDILDAAAWFLRQPEGRQGGLRLAARGTAGVPALLAAALEPRMIGLATERMPESYASFLEARRHRGLTGLAVPGILLDFDLPDAARLLTGRRFVLIDPVTGGGRLLRPPRSGMHPGYPQAAWRERVEGEPLVEALAGWRTDAK